MEHTINLAYKLDKIKRTFESINNSKNILAERDTYLKVNKEFSELERIVAGIDNDEIKNKVAFCKEARKEISEVLTVDFAIKANLMSALS